ncbi:MAG: alpha/beta fold hydrolase [Micavibrio sp.]
MSVEFLHRDDAPRLAYRKQAGRNGALPTILFLHGLWSDMEGTKAEYLADACAARGQAFVRFDCRGHGRSDGLFEDAAIGDWKRDALDIIDNVAEGALVLIGSSMGGWLSLLAALERPERVAGLIGLAAAPDFTREILAEMGAAQRSALEKDGYFSLHEGIPDFPCHITQKLLDEGGAHCLLPGPLAIKAPVRLVQGMKDEDVSWQTAQRIAAAVPHQDVRVYLREDGDHRLSTPEDLALIDLIAQELSGLGEDAPAGV